MAQHALRLQEYAELLDCDLYWTLAPRTKATALLLEAATELRTECPE
jgi:hypothetical protein